MGVNVVTNRGESSTIIVNIKTAGFRKKTGRYSYLASSIKRFPELF